MISGMGEAGWLLGSLGAVAALAVSLAALRLCTSRMATCAWAVGIGLMAVLWAAYVLPVVPFEPPAARAVLYYGLGLVAVMTIGLGVLRAASTSPAVDAAVPVASVTLPAAIAPDARCPHCSSVVTPGAVACPSCEEDVRSLRAGLADIPPRRPQTPTCAPDAAPAQHRDPATDLLHRLTLIDRLTVALARARRTDETVALTLLTLRCSSGGPVWHALTAHAAVVEIAECLRLSLREEDTVAYLGDSKFGVVARTADYETAKVLADRLACALPRCLADGRTYAISAGMAAFPRDGAYVAQLMARADEAMQASELLGADQCVFYASEDRTHD